jgi:hypothetical protein
MLPRSPFVLGVAVVALSACGGSGKTSAPTTPSPTPPPASTANGPGALQADATSAATGDIPDNQVFLVFRNRAAGYSIRYPEGWARSGGGRNVTFRDKNNIVRIVIVPDKRAGGKPGSHVVYRTQSAPNPVTGKRVKLVVDRYYFAQAGKKAILDLGTPEGVDNVDAFRLMSQSFRWK